MSSAFISPHSNLPATDSEPIHHYHSRSLSNSSTTALSPRPFASSFPSPPSSEYEPLPLHAIPWIQADSTATQNTIKRIHRNIIDHTQDIKCMLNRHYKREKTRKETIKRLNKSLDRLIEDTEKTAELVDFQRNIYLKAALAESKCSVCRLF